MSKKESVAVLDIGSEKMTVVVGERGVNNTLIVRGVGEVAYAGFLNGEFLEAGELKLAIGLALSNAEEEAGVSINELFIGVPTEFLFCICRQVSENFGKIKTIRQHDIDELFYKSGDFNELKTHMVINRSGVYYSLDDGEVLINPLGKSASKLSACISYIFIEKIFTDLFNTLVTEMGLEKVTYVSSELAQLNYLFNEEMRNRYIILLDVGYITTSVCLARGNGLLAMKSFNRGGGFITADLAECLKIEFNEAESLKRKLTLNVDPQLKDVYDIEHNGGTLAINARNANDIVKARIEEIASLINACLKDIPYDYPDYTAVNLTGGGLGYIKGAKDFLGKMLGKNVQIAEIKDINYAYPHLSSTLGVLDVALKQTQGIKKRGFLAKLFGKG